MLLTKEKFEKKVYELYGDFFDVSRADYKKLDDEIIAGCPIHGDFTTTVKNFLKGKGCEKCRLDKKTAETIEKAIKIHGDKYTYENFHYIKNNEKTCVNCKKHGEFEITPNALTNGKGCPECWKERRILPKTTFEDFEREAKRIHNNFYSYEHFDFKGMNKKGNITCPVHGDFEQTPKNHLKGQGCPECAKSKKTIKKVHDTESFIVEAKKVHGDRYGYEHVHYTKSSEKVSITCYIHGDFEQTPNAHLKGVGCPLCNGGVKLSRDEVINRFREVHGDTYNYDHFDYINYDTPGNITCKIHGDFSQSPNTHLRGQGCPICGIEKMAHSKSMTEEEFIRRAIEVHGDEYDYSDMKYKNFSTPVKIKHKKCGISRMVLPESHLRGHRCFECYGTKKLTYDEFVERAREVHGNKYGYEHFIYDGYEKEGLITCPKHGDFEQTPKSHLKGRGCPFCNESHGETRIRVYFEEKNIEFEYQKTYNDLRGKLPLSYDFYVPSKNLLIEYNGEQHYTSVKPFGGTKALRLQRHYDWTKRKYAKANKINYLIIPHWDFDNIEEILDKIFNN